MPELRLLVDPSLGPLDADEVARAFLQALGSGPGAEQVMSMLWGQADLLKVVCRSPYTTASGKILHLHQVRRRDLDPGS